jgi:hypothetical protein
MKVTWGRLIERDSETLLLRSVRCFDTLGDGGQPVVR